MATTDYSAGFYSFRDKKIAAGGHPPPPLNPRSHWFPTYTVSEESKKYWHNSQRGGSLNHSAKCFYISLYLNKLLLYLSNASQHSPQCLLLNCARRYHFLPNAWPTSWPFCWAPLTVPVGSRDGGPCIGCGPLVLPSEMLSAPSEILSVSNSYPTREENHV